VFYVTRDELGLEVTWDDEERDLARQLRRGLVLRGLSRARDWATGTVVRRYRDEAETLELLVEVLDEIGATHDLDGEVQLLRATHSSELALLDKVRDGGKDLSAIADIPEFRSGRRLLSYQQLAVARHVFARNAADFSVPGSGKTTVTLAYWALARREEADLGLWVIGPLSCFRPWEEEFEACFGRPPRAMRVRGSSAQRARLLQNAPNYELLLSSYQGAWRDLELFSKALQERPWLLALDEAHYIKSPTGVLSGAVRRLAPYAARRMVLTGTPMPRAPMDLWSQFTFLWPSGGLLGNAVQFDLRCRQEPDRLVPELRQELHPFFHRTCKDDLQLPTPVTEYPVIPADEVPSSQRLLIRLLERKTLEEDRYLSRRDRSFLRRWRRARLLRMLQAASNPLLLADALTIDQIAAVDDEEDTRQETPADETPLSIDDEESDLARALRRYKQSRVLPAKLGYIERRCRDLVQQGQKVVIWTVFLGNVDAVSDALADLRPLTISGAVPLYEDDDDEEAEGTREQRIELFKRVPERMVLIANMGACSESVSLHTVCQHALYLERSFNAAQFVQSLDRIHRQGMPNGTTAHVVIPSIPCGVERVLNRRLLERQRRLYALLNDPMPVVGFDDDAHRGLFDIEELGELDALFEEVLAEIEADLSDNK
jgi:SNF2-related domain